MFLNWPLDWAADWSLPAIGAASPSIRRLRSASSRAARFGNACQVLVPRPAVAHWPGSAPAAVVPPAVPFSQPIVRPHRSSSVFGWNDPLAATSTVSLDCA